MKLNKIKVKSSFVIANAKIDIIITDDRKAYCAYLKELTGGDFGDKYWVGKVTSTSPTHVCVCIVPNKDEEKVRSVIIHESVHVAEFIFEHTNNRRMKRGPKGKFNEDLAYLIQEVAWNVERAVLGKRKKRCPY